MLQTVVMLLLFVLGSLWYTGRYFEDTPQKKDRPLINRAIYGALLALALSVAAFWL